MKNVISELELSLNICETNEPINREDGNIEQAELEAVKASELRQAIKILSAIDSGPIWPEPKAS